MLIFNPFYQFLPEKVELMNILTTDLGRWGRLSVFPASNLSNLAKISLLQFSSCLLMPGSSILRNGRPILQIIYPSIQRKSEKKMANHVYKKINKDFVNYLLYCVLYHLVFKLYEYKVHFQFKKKIIQTLSTFLNLQKVGLGPTFWGFADSIKGLSEKDIG